MQEDFRLLLQMERSPSVRGVGSLWPFFKAHSTEVQKTTSMPFSQPQDRGACVQSLSRAGGFVLRDANPEEDPRVKLPKRTIVMTR